MMSQKKYWKSFGEQQQSEEYKKLANDEFVEELPFESFDNTSLLDAKAPRRDFLKYVGFSTAAAALAASCKQPIKTAIPYAIKPENMVPGIADYFATTYINNGEAIPVLAKVRDGRPIKIEGNDKCTFTNGGTSARVQASVLDLYDKNRLRFPVELHNGKHDQVPTFEILDKKIGEEMAALGGASVVLLTGTITSETTKKIVGEFLAKYPGSRAVQYDAVSYSGMLMANEATYSKKAIPNYNFANAKVIVSLAADFLGTWVAPIEFASQYAQGRKVSDTKKEMSKHYQFESFLSMTGANADERFLHKPSQTGAVAAAILAAVSGGAVDVADATLKAGITKVAAELKANAGKALVVSGSNDVNVQIIVNAINNAIGAVGTTIDWSRNNNCIAGDDMAMKQLVDDMSAGKVGALLVHGVNPVYSYYNSKGFADALKKTKLTISFNEKKDETSELCKYIIPDHHFLESWGDAEPKTGYTSFIQPTIHPLFKTRNFQTSLLKWSGTNVDYAEYYKAYWTTKLGGQTAFDNTLQLGIIEGPTVTGAGTFNAAKVEEAKTKATAVKTSEYEVALYQKVGMGDGRYANNPWLQELPDPITKATWDNYFIVGAQTAKKLGVDFQDKDYEYRPEKPLYKLTVGGITKELPILVIPGCAEGVIAVALGYGRSENIGLAAKDAGKNVFGLTSFDGATVQYTAANAKFEKAGGSYKVAQNQVHNYYEDRFEVVKERTLRDTIEHPNHILDERADEFANFFANDEITEAERKNPTALMEKFRKKATIYPDHAKDRAIHWGMNVDLNSCTGCGACVVACNAENNVSVVGKTEVTRGHDMHWIRIDRYFSSHKDEKNPDNVDVVFAPTMCQHCDNAPCENVCPVAATNHSSEGLNQMTYNRCIGTRYCANNCPYKVRRFNWADYTGADSFPNNQDSASGLSAVVVEQMNDDLTRMVLNPDVTVRSRGVIEKCSFCVQRLQAGKLDAKKESRVLNDKDIQVACAQACPTHAITFGNIKNTDSAIAKIRNQEQTQRIYYTLEPLHTLSNVSYLAKIRNKGAGVAIAGLKPEEHSAITHGAAADHGAEKHGGTTGEGKAEAAKPAEHGAAH
jgi:MoCo/4Fe-4S cofactor protein with predicted Tat translocation signal